MSRGETKTVSALRYRSTSCQETNKLNYAKKHNNDVSDQNMRTCERTEDGQELHRKRSILFPSKFCPYTRKVKHKTRGSKKVRFDYGLVTEMRIIPRINPNCIDQFFYTPSDYIHFQIEAMISKYDDEECYDDSKNDNAMNEQHDRYEDIERVKTIGQKSKKESSHSVHLMSDFSDDDDEFMIDSEMYDDDDCEMWESYHEQELCYDDYYYYSPMD